LFFGRVVPERAVVVRAPELSSQVHAPDVSAGQLRIAIDWSQVTAYFTSTGEVKNVYTLRNVVEDGARRLLDMIGYCHGLGYDVDITQAVNTATSEKWVFGIDVPAVSDSATKAGVEFADLARVAGMGGVGEYLATALADLREALKNPSETGFHCYRAVEALRNACSAHAVPTPKTDSAKWRAFREKYGVSRNEIMDIKHWADRVRHGHAPEVITDGERATLLQGAWSIVNRFVLIEARPNKQFEQTGPEGEQTANVSEAGSSTANR
jgi:hypothetical protein